MNSAIGRGNFLLRPFNGQRILGGRPSGHTSTRLYDEEEMVMDKLLQHYSSEGQLKQPAWKAQGPRGLATDCVDQDRVEYSVTGENCSTSRETIASGRRVVSLLSESATTAEVKAPAAGYFNAA